MLKTKYFKKKCKKKMNKQIYIHNAYIHIHNMINDGRKSNLEMEEQKF